MVIKTMVSRNVHIAFKFGKKYQDVVVLQLVEVARRDKMQVAGIINWNSMFSGFIQLLKTTQITTQSI